MVGSWNPILAAAHLEEANFRAAMKRPREAQGDLLERILVKNRNTEFGSRHAFRSISNLAQYRRQIPERQYEDFAPEIERIAQGESNVLTSERVIAFEETGGSEAGGKLIPYNEDALRGFGRAVLPWLAGLAKRCPGVSSGSAYVTLSPATRPPKETIAGIPIGLASDAAYLGQELAPAFGALLAVPPSVGGIREVDRWQVETLKALVEAEDLAFVSLWSPTFLLALLASLPVHLEEVSAGLDRRARQRLERALRSGRLDTTQLWPRLACISCWMDGPSAGFAEQLSSLFPHVALDPKGLLATEAAITVPSGPDGLAVPALTSCIIEFVDEAGEAGLSDELAQGGEYRAVISTEGGLYRYDLGDVVKCIGHEDNVPYLRFVGRAGRTSDMVGEKLTEAFVSEILSDLSIAGCVAACRRPPGYVLHIENVVTVEPMAVAREVEQRLCENPQYSHALRIGQLAPLRVAAEAQLATDAIAKGIASGRRMGDVKPLALIPLSGMEE
jgi:hypothetical protein